jgi:hypothetical protein
MCDACDAIVAIDRLLIGRITLDLDGKPFQMHIQCFQIWDHEACHLVVRATALRNESPGFGLASCQMPGGWMPLRVTPGGVRWKAITR